MHASTRLGAPLFVSWQITRDCDLCCLHCCTESAPGKRLPDELDADEAMRVADEIVALGVPYVMLCGGEPLVVPHFFALAETLGGAGVQLKIETNGQRFDDAIAARLARLADPLDPDQPRRRHRGDLRAPARRAARSPKAHAACRAVRAAACRSRSRSRRPASTCTRSKPSSSARARSARFASTPGG